MGYQQHAHVENTSPSPRINVCLVPRFCLLLLVLRAAMIVQNCMRKDDEPDDEAEFLPLPPSAEAEFTPGVRRTYLASRTQGGVGGAGGLHFGRRRKARAVCVFCRSA